MKESIEGKNQLFIYSSLSENLQKTKLLQEQMKQNLIQVIIGFYKLIYQNKGKNQIIPIGKQDMAEYQEIIHYMNQQQFQADAVSPEIESAMRKKFYKQSDDTNMYEDEMFADVDGERIEKSGNTYQDFMEYEDIFNSSGQTNYDRKQQIGICSNFNSNNNTTSKQQSQDKKKKNSKQQQDQDYMMMYDGEGIDCDICINKVNLNQFVQQQLDIKYFEKFNFYFAKGINEILANLNISHVILFKDYLFYDDDSEYLKRYYQQHEILPRFNLLSDFYANQYKETRPNLCIVSPNKIINKRNYKQAKLFIQNQERTYQQNEQDQQNEKREQNLYNNINIGNNDHPEDQHVLSPSLTAQEIKHQPNPASNFFNELDTHYINNQDQNRQNDQNKETWGDNNQLSRNQNKNVHQKDNQQVKNGSFMEDFYRFDQENSFDSKSHNIYSPHYTSENESSSSINKDPSQLLKNLTNNEKQSYKSLNNQKNDQYTDFKVDLNDDIFIQNPNIRQRGNFVSTIRKISNNGQTQIKESNSNNNLNKNNSQIDKNIQKQDNKNNTFKDINIFNDKNNNFIEKNIENISNSGQLTPQYLYQYNELEDIESQMPSYLKIYVEECNNMSFSQPQKQINNMDILQQITNVSQSQADQLKQLQTMQLQQQIQQLQQQHKNQSSSTDDKLNKNLQYKHNGQIPIPISQNSQEIKDNRFKLPLQKLQGSSNNVNSDEQKQPPLSARNHEEAYEDLRKKIAQHQKMMLKHNDENSMNKVTGQQINDITSNSSSQNQHQQFLIQQKLSSQNPSSHILNQNSINMISTDQNLPDQQYDEFLSVIATPKELNQQQMLQFQIQQKLTNKNSQAGNNKQQLQVETKPINNYDYLLKENRIQGGISDHNLKINHQQNQQQYQQNTQTLQQNSSQQHASQVSQFQQKQNSLLNRLPQNVKQQLALNLQENEQLQKNLRLNQNQQSPDRIWTDRDVNPRLAANPQKERPQQQNTVVIGKGEVKHLKGGKVLNRPLSNNNEILGSLSERIFLNKIEEEGDYHNQGYDLNKGVNDQHKELSQKIIQNALTNQINKMNTNANIQEIYRKYQQTKEENNQLRQENINSYEQQSLKGSGEHLSFIRNMQQKNDDNKDITDFITKVVIAGQQGRNSDHYEEYSNTILANHIKTQLNKQKQQQISDDAISKIHKSKINQLISKAVPSSAQSSNRKGVTANSSNIYGNSNNVAKQSINNSGLLNSNQTHNAQLSQQQQNQLQIQQLTQRSQKNKKSPPHCNYNNFINFQSPIINQNHGSQSSASNNKNNQNSQLNQYLNQQDVQNNPQYNSINTTSNTNTIISKFQGDNMKPKFINSSGISSKRQQQQQSKDHHGFNKQARTSSLIKNLSGGDDIFNESNYKISKQQKPNQAIIVPSPQHLFQQYQTEQLQQHNNYITGANNNQNKSPLSSAVSTSKAINSKQQSYSSMHNQFHQQTNIKAQCGKNTLNSTVNNNNQNGKVFFRSINASGNTSALKPQGVNTINNINTNNYVSSHNQNNQAISQNITPLAGMNNFKSTNNTSVKSYHESHQTSVDKYGSSNRQIQQQQSQQSQKNISPIQFGSNSNFINNNINTINNSNVNNSTFNQNTMNFDIKSQLSRTMMSTNRGGFGEVNSFNNLNNETTLNQKSLIQQGSSHSTTAVINNNNIQNNPIISNQNGTNQPSSQKTSSPNHKKKQKSESLSKSSQKINMNQNSNINQTNNQNTNNTQHIINKYNSNTNQIINNNQNSTHCSNNNVNNNHNQNTINNAISENAKNNSNQMNLQLFNISQNIHSNSNDNNPVGMLQQSPRTNGAICIGGIDLSQQTIQNNNQMGLHSPLSRNQNSFVPIKKQEFKLNISKIINQQNELNYNNKNAHSNSTSNFNMNCINSNFIINQNEENQENSYGFWTSRSTKQYNQQSSQLQYNGENGINAKYSSLNSKQPNLTDRKMVKTSNSSKQRKEAPGANLTDRNQYHRSQHNQKSENQKPSPQMRKKNTQKIQNPIQQSSINNNNNTRNLENHIIQYHNFNPKEKTNVISGNANIIGNVQKK